PPDAPIGNVNLRSQLAKLGWNESLYWDIRNHLMQRGVLASGRAKGGSVRLVAPTLILPDNVGVSAIATTKTGITLGNVSQPCVAEKDLYGPMANTIRKGWAKDLNLDPVVVEITAQQGSRVTGGKWTRPDITVAS